MNTDKHRLIHENETKQIIGWAMEVLNTLEHGLLEKPYENALVVEFGLILNFKRPKLEWKRVVL